MERRDWYCEDVLSGKLEIKKLWEDERVLAFHHPRPQAVIHAESYYSFNL
jgi:histidine triad (HIT) family protein